MIFQNISGIDLNELNVSHFNVFFVKMKIPVLLVTSYLTYIIESKVRFFILYYSWSVLIGVIAIKEIEAFADPKIMLCKLVKFEHFIKPSNLKSL